jgi:hypothetical protein
MVPLGVGVVVDVTLELPHDAGLPCAIPHFPVGESEIGAAVRIGPVEVVNQCVRSEWDLWIEYAQIDSPLLTSRKER